MSEFMRVMPALFVGRRQLVLAEPGLAEGGQQGLRCGACEEIIISAARPDLRDVVVKCQCGEYNQI